MQRFIVIFGLSAPVWSQTCTWAGHCLGDSCSTDDDCDQDWVCQSGVCSTSSPPTPTPKPTAKPTTRKPTTRAPAASPTATPPSGSAPTAACTWAGHCLGNACSSDDDCDQDWVCTNGVCSTSGAAPSAAPPSSPPSAAPPSAAPPTAISPTTGAPTVNAIITGYGAPDNCPPGLVDSTHLDGDGSYASPITMATTYSAVPQGSRIYIPLYQKYFIADDTCTECSNDWRKNRKYHFDLWLGGTTGNRSMAGGIGDCEICISTSSTPVVLNPASTYAVDTTPLFNTNTQQCIIPNCPVGVDQGNTCGNICASDANGCNGKTCAQCAAIMWLSTAKFLRLNANICNNDASTILGVEDVCQSGSTGYPNES